MTLREARCAFTECVARLITHAIAEGYEVALDEAMDRITEKDPTSDHMKGSLHEIGLAVDINLYKDGEYLSQTRDHEPLGEWWEMLGIGNGLPLSWGGRFKDGNHYSLAWGGKR